MKLEGMATSYKAISELPIDKQPDIHQCVATIVDAEIQSKSTKRTNMLIRLSRYAFVLGNYHWVKSAFSITRHFDPHFSI